MTKLQRNDRTENAALNASGIKSKLPESGPDKAGAQNPRSIGVTKLGDGVMFLTETDLARRWNISVKSIQKWRTYGGSVTFHKFGSAVRYSIIDVEEFETQASRRNTSEGGDNE